MIVIGRRLPRDLSVSLPGSTRTLISRLRAARSATSIEVPMGSAVPQSLAGGIPAFIRLKAGTSSKKKEKRPGGKGCAPGREPQRRSGNYRFDARMPPAFIWDCGILS